MAISSHSFCSSLALLLPLSPSSASWCLLWAGSKICWCDFCFSVVSSWLLPGRSFTRSLRTINTTAMFPQLRISRWSHMQINSESQLKRDLQVLTSHLLGAKHLMTCAGLWHLGGLSITAHRVPAGLQPLHSIMKDGGSLEKICLFFKMKYSQLHAELCFCIHYTQLWAQIWNPEWYFVGRKKKKVLSKDQTLKMKAAFSVLNLFQICLQKSQKGPWQTATWTALKTFS